jgi:hypothetical protein
VSRKSVTILGVKIPLANIISTPKLTEAWIGSPFLRRRNDWVAVAPSTPSKEYGSSSGTYLGGYYDYCTFSTFAVDNKFDDRILTAAKEQADEYVRRLNKLVQGEYV